jgi:drug/metabolite transporter (DMT)-like permease
VNTVDLIGFCGVSLILIAYFLNLNNRLNPNDIRYILLNLIGAILACLASVLMKYYPFVLLEGTWTIISVVAFIKYFYKRKS